MGNYAKEQNSCVKHKNNRIKTLSKIKNCFKLFLVLSLISVLLVGCSQSYKVLDIPNEQPVADPNSDVVNIDSEISDSVYLLRFDQAKDEEKRDVSSLIASGFSMKIYFFSDGRGYTIPGAGIEEFTWGNGTIAYGYRSMTYVFEDEYLLITDEESEMRFWYEKTDEDVGGYPVISEMDLP